MAWHNGCVQRHPVGEWVRYWQSPDRPLEAMEAHFHHHAYRRHSHETYSFGVTEAGSQSFTCRGAGHTSTAGMVMAFNPDDPHDGRATDQLGFTYRMIHVGAELVADVLADGAGRPPALPLFAVPVVHDPLLARTLRRLHAALLQGAALERDEQLAAALLTVVRRAGTRAPSSLGSDRLTAPAAVSIARLTRALLDEAYVEELTADSLASNVGCSRYVTCRAFQATYGLAPSEYQRQLRLRAARRLLARGSALAEVATEVGFADQAHLTRWFVRSFGITPGAYRRAAAPA
jgi:AraC-like DNA-binding protein